jgi:hypothetical protein
LELKLETIDINMAGTMNKRTLIKNIILYFEISLYILALICFIYFIIFGLKTKAFKCIIIIVLLLGFRSLQMFSNIIFHDILRLSVLIFIFMAMFLAEILNFYKMIPIYDKILHSVSGAMLFFVGKAFYNYLEDSKKSTNNNSQIMILFSMFFAIAIAGCWEIFEFSMDRIMGFHLQRDSLFDTMQDIICGTSVAILTALLVFLLNLKKVPSSNLNAIKAVDAIEDEKIPIRL